MNTAVILISGKGSRMNSALPKQFIKVKNKPIYLYTFETFYNYKDINRIILVTNPEYVERVKKEVKPYKKKPVQVIAGGSERYLSIKNAIDLIGKTPDLCIDEKVLIHDGVRANVSPRIIRDNISGLNLECAVLTALKSDSSVTNQPRVDTIHMFNGVYYRAQTPQSFLYRIAKEIFDNTELYKEYNFTDDISACIALGYDFVIVDGEDKNYKITTVEDLNRFKKEHE